MPPDSTKARLTLEACPEAEGGGGRLLGEEEARELLGDVGDELGERGEAGVVGPSGARQNAASSHASL